MCCNEDCAIQSYKETKKRAGREGRLAIERERAYSQVNRRIKSGLGIREYCRMSRWILCSVEGVSREY